MVNPFNASSIPVGLPISEHQCICQLSFMDSLMILLMDALFIAFVMLVFRVRVRQALDYVDKRMGERLK